MSKKYTIKNKNGYSASFYQTGATITNLYVKDKNDNLIDIVLGFENEKSYQVRDLELYPFIGPIVGRIAGRIGGSKFELNNKIYELKPNLGKDHLHGELSFRKWDIVEEKEDSITFKIESEDGDEGAYPCNIVIFIQYVMNDKNEFIINYKYTNNDEKLSTIVNLTNHSYFNLSGVEENVHNHDLEIDSNKILKCNENLIPNGEFEDIRNGELDFTKMKKVNNIKIDTCFVLNRGDEKKKEFDAKLYYEKNGIEMKVTTTYPGVVVYDAIGMTDGKIKGKKGKSYDKFSGICFETQYFPDAIRHKNFPSVVVKPKETKEHSATFAFFVKK